MSRPIESPADIPSFGALLAPFIEPIPEASRPAFLTLLERAAASRYREWADRCPGDERDGLLECAAREEEIADRVAALMPADAAKMENELAGARQAYAGAFEGRPLREQYLLQAGAERQGAAAWRLYASQTTDGATRREFLRCAELEEESSAYLEGLLGLEVGATRPT